MSRYRLALRSDRFAALIAICAFPIMGKAQIVLEFDEFPSGTVITNQYTVATFSSSPGNENYAVASPLGTPPNILCSGQGGVPNCLEDTYLDFTTPLSQFQMIAILQNSSTGTVAQFNLFEHGIHTRTQFLTGAGHPELRDVQLLNLDNLTRLEIVNVTAPTGWDEMILWQVPEPASLACICSALLVLLRRRNR